MSTAHASMARQIVQPTESVTTPTSAAQAAHVLAAPAGRGGQLIRITEALPAAKVGGELRLTVRGPDAGLPLTLFVERQNVTLDIVSGTVRSIMVLAFLQR